MMIALIEVAIALMPVEMTAHSTVQPIVAQQIVQSQPGDLLRARNLARQAAERANGGLNRYRAESAMHGIGTLLVQDQGDRWVFRFVGGAPASVPSVETVVTVMKGSFVVTVDYNGAIR